MQLLFVRPRTAGKKKWYDVPAFFVYQKERGLEMPSIGYQGTLLGMFNRGREIWSIVDPEKIGGEQGIEAQQQPVNEFWD